MNEPLGVLIVDDDQNMTRTLGDILAASGFAAETATNALEGLRILEAKPCQVVLTDIRMPGMNGVEFQQAIKEKYPDVRVILITAYADPELITKGRAQGALAFMDKPLDIPLLLSILRVIAERITRKAGPPPGSDLLGTPGNHPG
jgi:DNA-binding NtrC family response regulator